MRLVTEFRFQVFARSAATCASRIARLGHETFDYAMENNAIVEFLVRKLLDASDVVGRKIRPKLDHNAALGCFQDQCILFTWRCHV
jgi:hypothetical protein